jgi:hypothetical protein
VTEVEQAPSTPSFSKNQFNILVLQCRTYHINMVKRGKFASVVA